MMDLGRFDLVFRSGFLNTLWKHRLYPVVASQSIRYNKSIGLFQKFQIESRVLGWDNRFFYLQQRFVSKNQTYALAIVKAKFKKAGKGGMDPRDVAEICGESRQSPEVPGWVFDWTQAEKNFWDLSSV